MTKNQPLYFFFFSFLILLFIACAPPLKQFFPDTFYIQDHIYQNKPLGMTLTYIGNWSISTDPADMSDAGKKVAASLQSSGAELLFVGSTVEGTQGTRGIVEHLNLSNEEYLAEIQKINKASLEKDMGSGEFEAGTREMLRWEYIYKGLRFVEFFFKNGTYNIRIAFWTKPDTFANFVSVYEDIMKTLTVDNR